MILKDKLTEEFLLAVKEAEKELSEMQFHKSSFLEKGPAYYIEYKRESSIVEFLFGPSDWGIEMIVYTSKGKFAFGDLLQDPDISTWANNNRYVQESGRDLKKEILWFIELLKFSLPIIE